MTCHLLSIRGRRMRWQGNQQECAMTQVRHEHPTLQSRPYALEQGPGITMHAM